MSDAPVDAAPWLNANLDGWNRAMGLPFVKATPDEVVAELEVSPVHHQPYGIVHGGVHAGIIETVCSVGAAVHSLSSGRSIVGLENHTSFLHAVRKGTIRATARPLARGGRTQVWEANVTDDRDRVVATGRVRFLVLEPGSSVGGEPVALKEG